ncbi:hypothetical protein D1872_221460 [compost metagenome]
MLDENAAWERNIYSEFLPVFISKVIRINNFNPLAHFGRTLNFAVLYRNLFVDFVFNASAIVFAAVFVDNLRIIEGIEARNLVKCAVNYVARRVTVRNLDDIAFLGRTINLPVFRPYLALSDNLNVSSRNYHVQFRHLYVLLSRAAPYTLSPALHFVFSVRPRAQPARPRSVPYTSRAEY